jgi:glutamyl-tRNA synthetase
VFNPEKLDWFNQQHMIRLSPEELARRVQTWFEAGGLWNPDYLAERRAWFLDVLALLRPRVKRLGEFVAQGRYFFTDEVEYDADAVRKHLPGMAAHLAALDAAFAELADFAPAPLEDALRSVADARGVKAGSLIHAVRVAVTGRAVSPGLFDVLALVGRDRVRRRLEAAARIASSPGA